VAKKRKGARPAKKASRSVKKKAPKKAAPRRAMAIPEPETGLERPGWANFNPLKELMAKHLERLESAKIPDPDRKIANAIQILRQARTALTNECQPTMELPTS
jgi:hypothetical protein